MFLWLISTGLICFLLGIVLTLAVGQRDLLCWIMPADDDKLLPQVNPESTTPLVTSDQPISVELPEVKYPIGFFNYLWNCIVVKKNLISSCPSWVSQKVVIYGLSYIVYTFDFHNALRVWPES
jgi:hypothetical protein